MQAARLYKFSMKHLIPVLLLLAASPVLAEEPQIEAVTATRTAPETWRFDVTVTHPDTGWDHYADGWRVLDMDGNALGLRVLVHPHVDEQPFTRSLGGVQIPSATTQVQVQMRDLPAGWNAGMTVVDLR